MFAINGLDPIARRIVSHRRPIVPRIVAELFRVQTYSAKAKRIVRLVCATARCLAEFTNLDVGVEGAGRLSVATFLMVRLANAFDRSDTSVSFESVRQFDSYAFTGSIRRINHFLRLVFPVVAFTRRRMSFN